MTHCTKCLYYMDTQDGDESPIAGVCKSCYYEHTSPFPAKAQTPAKELPFTSDGNCLNCGETIDNREELTGQRRDSGDMRPVHFCDEDCEKEFDDF